MRNIISLTLVFSLLVAALQAAIDPSTQQSRKWTAVTGQTMEGKLVNLQDDTVHLILDGEKTAKIKFGQLSADDQRYVKAAATGQNLEQLADGNKVVAVIPGNSASYFIKKDRSLWGMGSNYQGQLGNKREGRQTTPILVAGNVKDAWTGRKAVFFKKQDGSTWGTGYFNNEIHTTPVKILDADTRLQVDWFILKSDGTLYQSASYETYDKLTQIASGVNLFANCGGARCLFTNSEGTLFFNNKETKGIYTLTSGIAELIGQGANSQLYYIKTDGSLWSFDKDYFVYAMHQGDPYYQKRRDQYDKYKPVCIATNVKLNGVQSQGWSLSGGNFTVFIKNDNSLWGIGEIRPPQKDNQDKNYYSTPFYIADNVSSVSTQDNLLVFTKYDGTVWAMGRWSRISGKSENYTSPQQIATGAAFAKCNTPNGFAHVMLVKKDGTLWAMGENQNGQIGDGTTIHREEPVQVKVPETPLSVLQTDTAGAGY